MEGAGEPTMYMEHKADDKLYVDFAGDKLTIVDSKTGDVQAVEFLVAILAASQLTYVEAVKTQQKKILLPPVRTLCISALAIRWYPSTKI